MIVGGALTLALVFLGIATWLETRKTSAIEVGRDEQTKLVETVDNRIALSPKLDKIIEQLTAIVQRLSALESWKGTQRKTSKLFLVSNEK
jgi:hypothetical protein